ncbi:MAG: flavodoxin [Gammaproteobacteria bacterium]|jgi:MioC protein|nr:flavodoxin [Gammaproteobacteria bacterium]
MATIAIMAGTVYGGAQYVAEQAVDLLQQLGHQALLFHPARLNDVQQANADHWLVITSTTGQGDIPDDLVPFFVEVQDRFPLFGEKSWAIIALGDSSYGDTYCGAGEKFRQLFSELQGRELSPMLRIDAGETLQPEDVALPWINTFYSTEM